jgi:Zn-dependent protease with chaperone function
MRPRSARPPLVSALVVLLAAGCAGVEFRAAKPEERQVLAQVLAPLLIARYGAAGTPECHVAIAVADAPDFNAWAAPNGDGPCDLGVAATAPAVNELAPRVLQTLLAHELAHVWSKHALGSARQTAITGRRSGTLYSANAQFNPDEEAEADALAARILTAAYGGGNAGCMTTADLYEGAAKDRRHWIAWLSRHPFPERRVEAIVKACLAAQSGTP